MLGTIIGILFLVTLLVLLVASIRRTVIAYREGRGADIAAIIGVAVVLLVFVCVILALLGPVIDPMGETILPGGVK